MVNRRTEATIGSRRMCVRGVVANASIVFESQYWLGDVKCGRNRVIGPGAVG